MNFTELPKSLSVSRSAVYIGKDKADEILDCLNSIPAEDAAKIKNHSDFYFFLIRNRPVVYDLTAQIDAIHVSNADIYNALQNFARKISEEIATNTEGLYTARLSTEQLIEAMQDYSGTPGADVFPTENFVEKLLTKTQ